MEMNSNMFDLNDKDPIGIVAVIEDDFTFKMI